MFRIISALTTFLIISAIYADNASCQHMPDSYFKEPTSQAGARNVDLPKRKNRLEIRTIAELTQPDTEYFLVQDIKSAATALTVKASHITINLNGHKITYLDQNGSLQGSGILISGKRKDIDILNGEIVQGQGSCINETGTPECSAVYAQDIVDLQMAGLKITYGAQNSPAVYAVQGRELHIYNNTFHDTGTSTTKTQVYTIDTKNSADTKIYNNSIRSERQSAIAAGLNSDIFQNEIRIQSIKTSAVGISFITGIVRQNRIFLDGRNITGLVAGKQGKILSNHIQIRAARRSEDISDSSGVCIKVSGASENTEIASNLLELYAESEKTISTSVYVSVLNKNNKVQISNNYISALGRSSRARASAITIAGNNESLHLTFRNNKIMSSWTNILFGDQTGHAGGSAVFTENTFIMSDKYAGYSTIRSLHTSRDFSAYFFSNKYESDASKESIDFEAKGMVFKELGFGWTIDIAVTNAGKPVSNASVVVKDSFGSLAFEGFTNDKGLIRTYLVEYVLTGQAPAAMQSRHQKHFIKYSTPHKIQVKKNELSEEKNIRAESSRIVIISL
ncbi:MAG: hypothetical protein RBT37_04645 [Dissulfurispiraceae bacterium]|nr:hypothetical protein [Dissulfurispiraceae bacterium]